MEARVSGPRIPMIPHSQVHPSGEVLAHKNLDLGPCIVISPRTLDLGQKNEENKPGIHPEAMTVYGPNSEIQEESTDMTKDTESVIKEKLKTDSPIHAEHKVNVNYSYTLHSPCEAQGDITSAAENIKADAKAPHSGHHKSFSFGSTVRPVVLPSTKEDDWRRRSVVSKDFSTGIKD
jgi:hypothetical protein